MHVYIHVPFCASRCVYCDFYVELQKHHGAAGVDAFLLSLQQEIEARWDGRELTPIQTLYIGGGTPSLLTAKQLGRILTTLQRYTPFALDAEITLEVNPAQVASPVEDYLQAGFNRFSLGVQSLNDAELKKLSRVHRQKDVERCIEDFYVAGATNLSIDLMQNTPLQTPASWEATLRTLKGWPLKHLSIYGLQVEAGTPLERLVQHHPSSYPLPNEDDQLEMAAITASITQELGFRRYEVSNYAQCGWESRHNMAYWRQASWWAFGPAAHGFIDGWRYEGVSDLKAYLQNPLVGKRVRIEEHERLENVFIFALRTRYGVALYDMQAQLSPLQRAALEGWMRPNLERGTLKLDAEKGRLWVSELYWELLHEILYPLPGLLTP